MVTVTLDTNVLILGLDGSDEERAAFQVIWGLEERGVAQLALTSRFDQDKENEKNLERLKHHYRIARTFPVIPSVARYDVSLYGQDILGDAELVDELQQMFGIRDVPKAKPNTLWDVDHLYAHLAAKRDYFVTYDSAILQRTERLYELGISVMDPNSFAAAIARAEEKNRLSGAELEAALREELELAFRAKLKNQQAKGDKGRPGAPQDLTD